ncbi:MAG: arginine--tRNA ligase [Minisyncoccota bacterium]
MNVRESLHAKLAEALRGAGVEDAVVHVEHPADFSHGDYATGAALQYAKQIGLTPRGLAERIVAALSDVPGVASIEIAGPGFINFRLSSDALAESVVAARENDMWGSTEAYGGKKVMVEYTDPNPFKEFHIGHLMSNAIGESLSRLFQFSGAEVHRANYQGDVGPHVAKAIWGIKKLSLDPGSAASLGMAYTAGAKAYEEDPTAKEEIAAINKAVYEHTDAEIDDIYTKGREASLRHFEELYEMLGTKFDHYFFESETAIRGVALVRSNPDIFVESDGAIVYKGEDEGLHTRVFLTSKGLPTYETKDLGLAQMKSEVWDADVLVTVTANEQKDYFKVMLAAMRKVLPHVAAKVVHVTHGMMRFAEGKMSSRTGNVVTGESLLNELIEVAKVRAQESRADSPERLARDVAVAAIKYQILKQGSGKDIIFDRERALSVEGDSGPYVQYAHARTHQIVEKASASNVVPRFDAEAPVHEIARLLHRFPEIVEYATEQKESHIVTSYLIELAAAFNSWYAQEQILDGTSAAAHKVALTDAVRRTLKNGLWILGIPAPEKM